MTEPLCSPAVGVKSNLDRFFVGGQETRDVRRADTTGDKTLDGRRLDEKTVEKSLQKNKKMNDSGTVSK